MYPHAQVCLREFDVNDKAYAREREEKVMADIEYKARVQADMEAASGVGAEPRPQLTPLQELLVDLCPKCGLDEGYDVRYVEGVSQVKYSADELVMVGKKDDGSKMLVVCRCCGHGRLVECNDAGRQ